MEQYSQIQQHIDEVTGTTAERRHEQQQQAAARRLQQMIQKQEKDEARKAVPTEGGKHRD